MSDSSSTNRLFLTESLTLLHVLFFIYFLKWRILINIWNVSQFPNRVYCVQCTTSVLGGKYKNLHNQWSLIRVHWFEYTVKYTFIHYKTNVWMQKQKYKAHTSISLKKKRQKWNNLLYFFKKFDNNF